MIVDDGSQDRITPPFLFSLTPCVNYYCLRVHFVCVTQLPILQRASLAFLSALVDSDDNFFLLFVWLVTVFLWVCVDVLFGVVLL